jgi:hypothetical protein
MRCLHCLFSTSRTMDVFDSQVNMNFTNVPKIASTVAARHSLDERSEHT